ncbi:MAG TPA: ABC transporter permease [Gemmataceae bacterium]|nr:ABC transporter permease [Gemmataceae bacterium]
MTRFFLLILKNLRRNPLRSLLTALAVVALVAVFSIIVHVLLFLEAFTTEKGKDVKLIVNERYRMMSVFDRRHVEDILSPSSPLGQELRRVPGFDPDKHTVWHFIGFTTDPEMKDKDRMFFAIATYPEKILTMTDHLEPQHFDPGWVEWMRRPPVSGLDNAGMVMGATQLAKLNLRPGDRFRAKSTTHFDGTALRLPIEMDFEIVGVMPEDSPWNETAFIDYAYLDRELRRRKNEFDGKVNYVWLQVPDQQSAEQVALLIEKSVPELRCETAASAYSRFMEPMKNILWGMKYFLVPAILLVMTLILANTFSLTVRERLMEMALLKVLGYRPWHILVLVLGESALVGLLAGLLGATFTYVAINYVAGGIRLTGMPALFMPLQIFWWGPVIGVATALLGGLLPALGAREVRVAEVFAKVA